MAVLLFISQQVATWIGSALLAILSFFLVRIKYKEEVLKLKAERKKIAVEEDNYVVQQYETLAKRLNEEYDRLSKSLLTDAEYLNKRIEHNEITIRELQLARNKDMLRMTELEKDNENCKYQHAIVELELKLVKSKYFATSFKKEKIAVLDDDPDVIEEFKERFSKIDILDFTCFTEYRSFITYANTEKPQIIVTDYRLGIHTAEDLLLQLTYEPEVIVMSGVQLPAKFMQTGIRFFKKEDHYIYKIAISIINYLNQKYDEQRNNP